MTTPLLKILIVVDTMGTGGKERRLLELLKGLAREKSVEVGLVILSDIVEYDELYSVPIPVHRIRRKQKKDISLVFRLQRIVRQVNPDIIQSWSSLVSVLLLPTVLRSEAKFVNAIIASAPRSLKPFSSKWIQAKASFPLSDAIVSNSQAGLKAYHAPPHKSYCIPNGIDLNRFKNLRNPRGVWNELGITTKHVIGMVASFRGSKDYQTYLEAATLLLEKRDDVTFLALGEGKDLQKFQTLYQAERKIIFTGRISDVESIVNIFDIGVLMTDHRVHGEGIPNCVMEYMALRKPVIATDAGGTIELVIDQVTGLICEQRNAADLASKIDYLLNNPQTAHAMGEAGRKRIEDEFTLENMTKSYINLYYQLSKTTV